MNTWDHKKWYLYAVKRRICYCWNIRNYKYCAEEDESCDNGRHICLYCDFNNLPPQRHQSKDIGCPCQTKNYNPNLGESHKRTFDEAFGENLRETARRMSATSDENVCTAPSCSCPSAQKAGTCSRADVVQPVRPLSNSNSEAQKLRQPPAQGLSGTTLAPACCSHCEHHRRDVQSGESFNHHDHNGGVSSPSPTEPMHRGGDLGGACGFQENPRRAVDRRQSNTQQYGPPSNPHQAGDSEARIYSHPPSQPRDHDAGHGVAGTGHDHGTGLASARSHHVHNGSCRSSHSHPPAQPRGHDAGHGETHGGVAGASHDPGTAPARSHHVQNGSCRSSHSDHYHRDVESSESFNHHDHNGDVSSSRQTDTEYPKSWRPEYDKLHYTFGRNDERKESLEKTKSPINQQKRATAGMAETRVSNPVQSSQTYQPTEVDDRVLFLENENEMLRSELTKERADNHSLKDENVKLKLQLGEARTMKPFSRLNLINNIPSGFDDWAKLGKSRSNQNNNLVPGLGSVQVPPLFNRKSQDSSHGASSSRDNGQDIFHLYGNSKDNQNQNQVYPDWFLLEHKGKNKEDLKDAWENTSLNMSFDRPQRDLVKEINYEMRNGIRPKPLFS